jgi:hypothetical protein
MVTTGTASLGTCVEHAMHWAGSDRTRQLAEPRQPADPQDRLATRLAGGGTWGSDEERLQM